ncbi:39S ribosomal protein L53, mitochondrial [Zootermopsis nevadensis]|uniref:39S ribosomal protein L53, mitochondrial n=1 Tax=Zootermopsis nevadensis TaxID=136037 RepID=UPI000B8E8A50|nr:39S ribosomal protein L53, mitochondrial [Zootermopsis nevadensis]
MSVPFSGTLKRSAGISSAIAKQLRFVNLKPLKKVIVKFDPFDKNVTETREFLFSLTGSKILATNLNCKIKTEILCDRSEPSITFTLNSKEVIVFKSGNLTNLELLQLYNKHITPLATTEEPETSIPKTKSEKKAGKRR